jgi:hypothetical protein
VLSWKLPARVEVNLRITAYLCNSAGDVEHGHRAGANADGRAAGGNGIKSNGANRDPVRKRATLMLSSSADALLFDLGRVVIDIDFNRAFSRWAGHARCDQKLISERFRHDDTAYKRHERGEIDSEEFFDNLRASLAIDISDAQLLEGWNSILVGEMPGVSELLAEPFIQFRLPLIPERLCVCL